MSSALNDSNRITEIKLYLCKIRLKVPFIISLGKFDHAENVVVVLHTSEGITGFGECSPFPSIHGETAHTCMAVGKLLAETLIGEDACNIAKLIHTMDARIYGNTSIKSAFDMALHDVASRQAGLPLYKFLGGSSNREMVTDYTVSIGSPDKMADDAEEIVQSGFQIIKIKLGGNVEEDLRRVKLIRERAGKHIPLRIDANQGWSIDDAVNILRGLEPFNIQHCEEPIHRKKFMSLPEVRKSTSIPLMADESCFDHLDAERLLIIKACDLLNIKLGKSGIHKACKIVKLAESNNMSLQAGGFLESRLGFTATAHLALSSDKFIHFDFDTPLMLAEDIVSGGITYQSKGRIKVPDEVGLGATIDEERLNAFEKITVSKG